MPEFQSKDFLTVVSETIKPKLDELKKTYRTRWRDVSRSQLSTLSREINKVVKKKETLDENDYQHIITLLKHAYIDMIEHAYVKAVTRAYNKYVKSENELHGHTHLPNGNGKMPAKSFEVFLSEFEKTHGIFTLEQRVELLSDGESALMKGLSKRKDAFLNIHALYSIFQAMNVPVPTPPRYKSISTTKPQATLRHGNLPHPPLSPINDPFISQTKREPRQTDGGSLFAKSSEPADQLVIALKKILTKWFIDTEQTGSVNRIKTPQLIENMVKILHNDDNTIEQCYKLFQLLSQAPLHQAAMFEDRGNGISSSNFPLFSNPNGSAKPNSLSSFYHDILELTDIVQHNGQSQEQIQKRVQAFYEKYHQTLLAAAPSEGPSFQP